MLAVSTFFRKSIDILAPRADTRSRACIHYVYFRQKFFLMKKNSSANDVYQTRQDSRNRKYLICVLSVVLTFWEQYMFTREPSNFAKGHQNTELIFFLTSFTFDYWKTTESEQWVKSLLETTLCKKTFKRKVRKKRKENMDSADKKKKDFDVEIIRDNGQREKLHTPLIQTKMVRDETIVTVLAMVLKHFWTSFYTTTCSCGSYF